VTWLDPRTSIDSTCAPAGPRLRNSHSIVLGGCSGPLQRAHVNFDRPYTFIS
jgi:hypothetical protein